MEYPKIFDHCPLCKCNKRVVEQETEELKKERRVDADKESASTMKFVPLVPPTAFMIAIPVLLVYYDYCAGCGWEYPTKIIKKIMTQEQVLALMGVQVQKSKQERK